VSSDNMVCTNSIDALMAPASKLLNQTLNSHVNATHAVVANYLGPGNITEQEIENEEEDEFAELDAWFASDAVEIVSE
jgi:hypothetical protein